MIPDHCKALWKQLVAGGSVDVNEQEIGKANDIKTLFEMGLIRFTFPKVSPTVTIVLSEAGKVLDSEI